MKRAKFQDITSEIAPHKRLKEDVGWSLLPSTCVQQIFSYIPFYAMTNARHYMGTDFSEHDYASRYSGITATDEQRVYLLDTQSWNKKDLLQHPKCLLRIEAKFSWKQFINYMLDPNIRSQFTARHIVRLTVETHNVVNAKQETVKDTLNLLADVFFIDFPLGDWQIEFKFDKHKQGCDDVYIEDELILNDDASALAIQLIAKIIITLNKSHISHGFKRNLDLRFSCVEEQIIQDVIKLKSFAGAKQAVRFIRFRKLQVIGSEEDLQCDYEYLKVDSELLYGRIYARHLDCEIYSDEEDQTSQRYVISQLLTITEEGHYNLETDSIGTYNCGSIDEHHIIVHCSYITAKNDDEQALKKWVREKNRQPLPFLHQISTIKISHSADYVLRGFGVKYTPLLRNISLEGNENTYYVIEDLLLLNEDKSWWQQRRIIPTYTVRFMNKYKRARNISDIDSYDRNSDIIRTLGELWETKLINSFIFDIGFMRTSLKATFLQDVTRAYPNAYVHDNRHCRSRDDEYITVWLA
jgi:hypothetical protein